MNETLLWIFNLVGLAIIGGLLIFIRKKWLAIEALKKQTKAVAEAKEETHKSHRLGLVESIQVITNVMLDDQVDLSEGCLRLRVLLDNLDAESVNDERWRIIYFMSDSLAHMPTHQARKEVDKAFLRKLDQQRLSLEAKHRDEIRDATKILSEWVKSSEMTLIKQ